MKKLLGLTTALAYVLGSDSLSQSVTASLKEERFTKKVTGKVLTQEELKTRATLPGRNEPCICGSNRKFKKCCSKNYNV